MWKVLVGIILFISQISISSAQIMMAQPVTNIIHAIKTHGYNGIQKIELINGVYVVSGMDDDGTRISVKLNAHSGDIISFNKIDPHIAMLEVVEKVEANGYGGITYIELKNGIFNILAKGPNGQSIHLTVDAITGEISK